MRKRRSAVCHVCSSVRRRRGAEKRRRRGAEEEKRN